MGVILDSSVTCEFSEGSTMAFINSKTLAHVVQLLIIADISQEYVHLLPALWMSNAIAFCACDLTSAQLTRPGISQNVA